MVKEFTYANAGVDRKLRAETKKGFSVFRKTYRYSKYGPLIRLPYNTLYPIEIGRYLDHQIESIGTKVLLAQLADKYDTIGIDAVAMVVNDVIRSGARPMSISDEMDMQKSYPYYVHKLKVGILYGAKLAETIVPSGEMEDVPDVLKSAPEREERGFRMSVSCVGEVYEKEIIRSDDLKVKDSIIGLRSSGLHSSGVSIAREILFKAWKGKYDPFDIPNGFKKTIAYEALKPTEIYVKPVLEVRDRFKIKAAVHITGNAYLKFDELMRFNKGIGFKFDNFKPQPIFQLIQDIVPEVTGKILTNREMLQTFNMGWGFALIANKDDTDSIIDTLGKNGVEAEEIGKVIGTGKIECIYKENKIRLY